MTLRFVAPALAGGLIATLLLFDAGAPVRAMPSDAASFDCGRAATPTERAICHDPKLTQMDRALGQAYQARVAREPAIRQQQRGWLRARDAGCAEDRACLAAFMTAREAWLRRAAPMPTGLPRVVGQCSLTVQTEKTNRFEGEPDSGSAAAFANGAFQVSYERVAGVERSRVGDPAIVCLASLPEDCPKGDERGKVYASADLRTLLAWSLPDAEHMCGGA